MVVGEGGDEIFEEGLTFDASALNALPNPRGLIRIPS
jgi:hypothetical protein